ncbi:MAG: 4-hydroxy-tetrahydrodipicolinate synthase [Planctomycetota bacterium]|nr:MAG: 4-hydroxy-tetrahydrodipicolinate synthase [Planctomycetota bacterium]
MSIKGIWFPIITPFKDGEVDYVSYERLLRDALSKGVHGVIPLGTTGESPTITAEETNKIVDLTVEVVNKSVPVYIGCGGNNTRAIVEKVKSLSSRGIDGVLSVVPYYNKPGPQGLVEHFTAIADASDLKILMYNIPYRTCINMSNESVCKLAEHENIVGIKDSCGIYSQSIELLVNKPSNFSIFTGDDLMFYTTITNGGDGGILASSHINTEQFINLYNLVLDNDHQAAFEIWKGITSLIPLLFKEPNPTPIKFILKEQGLIDSDEVRLPLTLISDELKEEIRNTIK